MHVHDTEPWKHEHDYLFGYELESERRTLSVFILTVVMMIAEIIGGYLFNSMALLADGWHMSTHAAAMGIAAFAYFFARKQARNRRFTFGTGKINALGGFASAILLVMVAVLVAVESITRLYSPRPIIFDEAILVASAGLAVNLISAWLLRGKSHSHTHKGDEHTHTHHHDHNLKAAFVHVIADAFTSVLAIAGLCVGKYAGWLQTDPLIGLLGSGVIAFWSISLVRQTAAVLVDRSPDAALEQAMREAIERDADNIVTDLHLWHIAPGQLSAIVSLVTDHPQPPKHYKALLGSFDRLVHVTVEVNRCEPR